MKYRMFRLGRLQWEDCQVIEKKTYQLKTLNIRFNKESFLDDILVCATHKTEQPDTYAHIISKDNISICEIQTAWIKNTKTEDIFDYDLAVKSET